MKLSHLLLAGGAASLSYLAVKNREKIAQELQENTALVQNISDNYATIQEQLEIIKNYQEPLSDMVADLDYKLRVYRQNIAGNVAEIQKIREKYSPSVQDN